MNVHLVDGTYELFRAFYGAPPRKNAAGEEVGAVRALTQSLVSLLTKEGATHVAVAWDRVIESFRNRLFAGYKTGEGIDPALWAQFPLAEQAAERLGFVSWPMVEFEADDALATAAARFEARPEVEQIRLCSPDKDLMQCVRGARVVVVDRRRAIAYDAAAVETKLGVPPALVPDLLALVGDAADGIPGLPGFGMKTAVAVLVAFGGLDRIPDDPERWPPVRGRPRLAATLVARRADALLYRTLATLRTDVPLAEPLEQLAWRPPAPGAVAAVADRLDDPGLPGRLPTA